jgi:diamine N-acetyltransferase
MKMGNENEVSLKQIRSKNLGAILNLDVDDNQKSLVASNARSIAQAHYSKHAWYRAIYAGDEPVGFVMLYLDKSKPEYYLWRLMVDQEHQGKGYGFVAMQMVIDFIRSMPKAKEFFTSYVPGKGNPSPFYRKLGFKDTGEMMEGEKVMRLEL